MNYPCVDCESEKTALVALAGDLIVCNNCKRQFKIEEYYAKENRKSRNKHFKISISVAIIIGLLAIVVAIALAFYFR